MSRGVIGRMADQSGFQPKPEATAYSAVENSLEGKLCALWCQLGSV